MDLRDLYQEIILDHYKKPRNASALQVASHEANGHNPLCGDRIKVSVQVTADGVVQDVGFEGSGCAISTASASMMTEAIKGKTLEEVEELFQGFHGMVTGKEAEEEVDLGKLEALSGVREIPIRVKCATLAWHTLQAAIKNTGATAVSTTVTTE